MGDLNTPWKLYIDRPDPHSISSFEPTYNIRDDEGDFVVCDIPKDRAEIIIACVNALDGLNPAEVKELVKAVDRTVSVWQYEPCHAKALALERAMGDLQDALAKVKKED